MNKYLKKHEELVLRELALAKEGYDYGRLKKYHAERIAFMQSERHMHLLVTLFFGVFLLMSIGLSYYRPVIEMFLLAGLFFILLVPYIIHYYTLENGVQRWYKLMDEIDKRNTIKN